MFAFRVASCSIRRYKQIRPPEATGAQVVRPAARPVSLFYCSHLHFADWLTRMRARLAERSAVVLRDKADLLSVTVLDYEQAFALRTGER